MSPFRAQLLPDPDGFFFGVFVATTSPLSYRMNEQTKSDFGFENVHAAGTQFGWGGEFSYSIPLGRHGLYAVAGASVPMPGLGGSVGSIEMQPGCAYTIIRDRIRVYSFRGFLGGGYRFGKG